MPRRDLPEWQAYEAAVRRARAAASNLAQREKYGEDGYRAMRSKVGKLGGRPRWNEVLRRNQEGSRSQKGK